MLTSVTKRNIIGTWCFHRFIRPDKTVFEVECTKAEYDTLAKKNAKQPTHIDGKWLLSCEVAKFDSLSGKLGVNEYYTKGGMHVVNNNGDILIVDSNKIVNDNIDYTKVFD
jgi:hypothetical protein